MILHTHTIDLNTSSLDALNKFNCRCNFAFSDFQTEVIVEKKSVWIGLACPVECSMNVIFMHSIVKVRPLSGSQAKIISTSSPVNRFVDDVPSIYITCIVARDG